MNKLSKYEIDDIIICLNRERKKKRGENKCDKNVLDEI